MLRALYLCTGVVRAIGRTSPDVYTSNYVVMATDLQTCICLQWARVSVQQCVWVFLEQLTRLVTGSFPICLQNVVGRCMCIFMQYVLYCTIAAI